MTAFRTALAILLLATTMSCAAPTRPSFRLTVGPVDAPAAEAATGVPAAPAATATPLVLPTPPGEAVQPAFFKTVEPPYRAGTRWRRRVTAEGNQLLDITEVLAVEGDTAHLRQRETREDGVTAVPARDFDVSVSGNPLTAALPAALGRASVPLLVGLQGYEDMSVPAGKYPHCAKLGFSGLDGETIYTGTAWLADGVGVVKLVATTQEASPVTSTQELVALDLP
ncbi:MAG: hypothetical protein JWM80_8 [Cyanobacteria bacterium RYN_339]|nr:hypothetical protein [Cyanobacteria bacterium RYN_339]